jgi:hypothetical protein
MYTLLSFSTSGRRYNYYLDTTQGCVSTYGKHYKAITMGRYRENCIAIMNGKYGCHSTATVIRKEALM